MLVLHAHGGFGLAAHGIHDAVVAVGVLGLVALLAPRFLLAPHAPHAPHAPRDEHEQRVLALRTSLADPGLATGNPSATSDDPTRVATQETWLPRAPGLAAAQRAWLPLAVVSSASAAVRTTQALLFLGVTGNLLVIALWAITRTLGLPLGLLVALSLSGTSA